MIRKAVTVINDFSGGQDTKTPLINMPLNKSPNMRNFHCAGVGNRLIKRDGFAKVNSSVIASDGLDVYYPPGFQTYDYALRDAVARTQISQGFKSNTSAAVKKVRLWLKKTGSPTGNINIEIQTDSSGVPSGTAVTNGTSANLDIATKITTTYAWVTFTFATQPTLTAGTQYHLVFQGDNTINGTAYVQWGADDYDVVYPDGSMSAYDATTWGANGTHDAIFEIYITGGAKGNDGYALFDFSSKNMVLGIWGSNIYKMDKGSTGTPDGTWDALLSASVEVDYMEYATDAAAQAAYVSSDTSPVYGPDILTGGTPTAESSHPSFPPSNACDDNEASYWQSEYLNPAPDWWKYDLGAGITKIPRKLRIKSHATIGIKDFIFQGSNNDSDWTNLYNGTSAATSDWQEFTFSNSTPYRYLRLYITSFYDPNNAVIYEIEVLEIKGVSLQSYSESTIKTQGSYSLKGIALATSSLNDTLTRTIGSPIDLSNQDTLKFSIYSSRTGSNIKIGIHDSGGTTTEITPNITTASVWQTVVWDISSVANVNKDAIDRIIITIVNADADNTFYIDNFYAASNLTSSRFWTFGDWQSGRALINTDIGLYTYTGSGDASLVTAAPRGKFLAIWKNYAFIFGIRGSPNNGQYSTLSDYSSWPAGNTFSNAFNTNDGDVITGVRMLKGRLYVFKRYSIHRITYLGSNPTFQVDQVAGIGCPCHFTIKEVDMGGDIGSVLIFLTTDKKLAIFDGYNIQIINDSLTEETNDLFATADDQPLSFSDMNFAYIDLFHAVVKTDTHEYILYCVLGTDTVVNYGFVFDYKTGGVYPYDGQIFASSCYAMSTDKIKKLYCSGYTGYTWLQESGNSDDGSAINAYWVSGKIRPQAVSLLNKLLQLFIHYKEVTSVSILNANFQFRLDWNVSWSTAQTFSFNHNDELAFGKSYGFDIGTIENMFQVKIKDNSSNPAPTIYGIDLYGEPIGVSINDRATA